MKLLDRLLEHVTDKRELEPILGLAAGGSQRLLTQDRVEFTTPPPNERLFATAKFRRGEIVSLTPGPALLSKESQDDLVRRVQLESSHEHGHKAADRVLVAERKLCGYWQWRNRLRIEPTPPSTPVASGLDWASNAFRGSPSPLAAEGPPYPLLLRIRVPASPNPFVEADRVLSGLDIFQNLVTLLVSGHIRGFNASSSRSWVLVDRGSGIENHLLHPGFALGETSEWLGDRDVAIKPAQVFQGEDYYNHLWPRDEHISIPSTLAQDLDRFDALCPSAASQFARAVFWYGVGIRTRLDTTVATVAFSTAVECLLRKTKRTRCSVCSSELGPGPTQLFKAHICRYGTLPESLHSQRAEIYSARSALVHGSYAAPVDCRPFSAARASNSQGLLIELVAQRSLVNWLRDAEREVHE